MFIYQKKLQKAYQDDVWELLCASDKEFIPPLSERNSTTQQTFTGVKAENSGLLEYFQHMLEQEFILAIENDKVIGFISFIPDHNLNVEGKEYKCDYVSTLVVSGQHRGRGLAGKMYQALFENRAGKNYATRTWSTNYAHLHLLKKMDFELIALIPNERGDGIDTVYYFKEGNG